MNEQFWLLTSLSFFTAMVLLVGAYAVLRKQAKFTDPILQFLFFFSLFVLPLPIRAYNTLDIEGDITEHLSELLPYIPEAVFLCGLGLIAFAFAYYSSIPARVARGIPRIRTGTNWKMAFIFLASLSLLLLTLLARSSGGLLSFILLGYTATAEMVGKGYLATGFPWLFIASLFLLYGYAHDRKKRYLFYFACAMGVNVAIQLVMARRAMLLYFGLVVWLFWHHAVRPVRARYLIVGGLFCFLALNLIGILRGSSSEDVDSLLANNKKAWSKSSDDNDALFYTLTTGQFVVPFETLPQMIESVGNSVNPELGRTYLRAPLQVIPQALYPGRPLPLANWYVQQFYGSGYEFNEGRQFFFLSEGYLNFGVLGVFLTMAMWGFFLGTIHQYRISSIGNPAALLAYSIVAAYIYIGIGGESITWIVGLPELGLGAALVGLWISARQRKRGLVLAEGLS
jgi:hypothetical protein